MNIKLDLGTETTTYSKLLEGEENWMEAGMQNMSIYIKTTNGYSGGLSSPYRDLTSPGLNNGLCLSSFCSHGGSSAFSQGSSSRAVVVKKFKICNGKLVCESSNVLLSK